MRLTIFKLLALALSSAFASTAAAQMVPVTDMGVEASIATTNTMLEQLSQANTQTGAATTEAINANGKILGNINQALANVFVSIAKGQEQVKQLRRNADLYDPTMGAKPQSSCGILSSTVAIAAGNKAKAAVVKKLNDIAEKHMERSKYMDPNEDMATDRGSRFLAVLEKEQALTAESGPISISGHDGLPADQNGEQAWLTLETKMVNMAVPNPVKLPPDSDNPNQSIASAIQNAPKRIQVDRQKMVGEIVTDFVSNRTKLYQADWVKKLVYKGEDGELQGVKDSILADLETGASKSDVETILNTYRLKNAAWVTHTSGTANEVGLARDSNIMQAQALEMLHGIYQESKRTNLLLAFMYAHNIEQSGPPAQHSPQR